jgi:hypothetical protein
VEIKSPEHCNIIIETYDATGKLIMASDSYHRGGENTHLIINPEKRGIDHPGLYFTRVIFGPGHSQSFKWIYSGQ